VVNALLCVMHNVLMMVFHVYRLGDSRSLPQLRRAKIRSCITPLPATLVASSSHLVFKVNHATINHHAIHDPAWRTKQTEKENTTLRPTIVAPSL
jgi:hypothetical protein